MLIFYGFIEGRKHGKALFKVEMCSKRTNTESQDNYLSGFNKKVYLS